MAHVVRARVREQAATREARGAVRRARSRSAARGTRRWGARAGCPPRSNPAERLRPRRVLTLTSLMLSLHLLQPSCSPVLLAWLRNQDLEKRAEAGETVVKGGTGGKSLDAQLHLAEGNIMNHDTLRSPYYGIVGVIFIWLLVGKAAANSYGAIICWPCPCRTSPWWRESQAQVNRTDRSYPPACCTCCLATRVLSSSRASAPAALAMARDKFVLMLPSVNTWQQL
ncbi:unnamed protein product [Closterium sp. NIES-54]